MKLSAICNEIGCPVPEGAEEIEVTDIASPEEATGTSVTFVAQPKYLEGAARSAARFVIVKHGVELDGKTPLHVDDPYVAYAKVALLFEDTTPLFEHAPQACYVHPSARIDPGVCLGPMSAVGEGCSVGKGTVVGAGCVIEKGCRVGEGCRIESGVILRRYCTVGNRVIIQSGAVIGSEGFGNAWDGSRFVRIPSFGNVIIENEAEIGAGTTIDRGALGPTVIGRGVKLDNLIHIAHNVRVGDNTAMAAQVGISGSTSVGERVKIGGQAGFVGHIHIGNDSFVGAKAGVSKSVDPDSQVTGYPARDFMTMRRIEAAQLQLPALVKELRRLRKRVDELEKKGGGEATGENT